MSSPDGSLLAAMDWPELSLPIRARIVHKTVYQGELELKEDDHSIKKMIKEIAVRVYQYERQTIFWHQKVSKPAREPIANFSLPRVTGLPTQSARETSNLDPVNDNKSFKQESKQSWLHYLLCIAHNIESSQFRAAHVDGPSSSTSNSDCTWAEESALSPPYKHEHSHSPTASANCRWFRQPDKPCDLPILWDEDMVSLGKFECLFYVILAKIQELYNDLRSRIADGRLRSPGFLHYQGVTCHDEYPCRVDTLLKDLLTSWLLLTQPAVTATLDAAIRMRNMGRINFVDEMPKNPKKTHTFQTPDPDTAIKRVELLKFGNEKEHLRYERTVGLKDTAKMTPIAVCNLVKTLVKGPSVMQRLYHSKSHAQLEGRASPSDNLFTNSNRETVWAPPIEPLATEPPTIESPTIELPTFEPSTFEPCTFEPPTSEPPARERKDTVLSNIKSFNEEWLVPWERQALHDDGYISVFDNTPISQRKRAVIYNESSNRSLPETTEPSMAASEYNRSGRHNLEYMQGVPKATSRRHKRSKDPVDLGLYDKDHSPGRFNTAAMQYERTPTKMPFAQAQPYERGHYASSQLQVPFPTIAGTPYSELPLPSMNPEGRTCPPVPIPTPSKAASPIPVSAPATTHHLIPRKPVNTCERFSDWSVSENSKAAIPAIAWGTLRNQQTQAQIPYHTQSQFQPEQSQQQQPFTPMAPPATPMQAHTAEFSDSSSDYSETTGPPADKWRYVRAGPGPRLSRRSMYTERRPVVYADPNTWEMPAHELMAALPPATGPGSLSRVGTFESTTTATTTTRRYRSSTTNSSGHKASSSSGKGSGSQMGTAPSSWGSSGRGRLALRTKLSRVFKKE